MRNGLTYIFDTGKRLTKKQAQNVRRNDGEIIVEGKGSKKLATEIEKGAFKNDPSSGKMLHHSPHGGNDMFRSHYQTNKKEGHTSYRELGLIFAPNVTGFSEDYCPTNQQMASAFAWDAAGLFDPVGITDTIDAYTGLDGGEGGLYGVGNFIAENSPITGLVKPIMDLTR